MNAPNLYVRQLEKPLAFENLNIILAISGSTNFHFDTVYFEKFKQERPEPGTKKATNLRSGLTDMRNG